MILGKVPRWAESHWHWIALAVLAGLSLGIRLAAMSRYPLPPGADPGLYLAQAHLVGGLDVAELGPVFPPLSVLPLVGLLHVFDPATALRLFTAMPASLLPVAFYPLAARFGPRPYALLASALFGFAEGYSEMTAWDGREFAGIVFMLASLVFLLRCLDGGRRRDLLLAGLAASLVVGTHQLTASILVASVALWAVLEFLRTRDGVRVRSIGLYAAVAGALSLPYVPFYSDLRGRLAVAPPSFDLAALWTVQSIQVLLSSAVLFWIVVGLLSLVGIAASHPYRTEVVLLLSMSVMSVVLALTVVHDNPIRPLHYLYVASLAPYPAFFVWFRSKKPALRLSRGDRAVRVAVVGFTLVLAGALVGLSVQRLSTAVDFYHAIEGPELEALEWVHANVPMGVAVATNGPRNGEGNWYGWWIEGYGKRQSFFSGTLTYFSYIEERRRVSDANRFFVGNYVLENGAVRVVDNFGGDRANPEIWVRWPDDYRLGLYLDDLAIIVNHSSAQSGPEAQRWAPSAGDVGERTWSWSDGRPSIRIVRNGTDVRLERVQSLDGNRVVVDLTFTASEGVIRSSEIPIAIGRGNQLVQDIATDDLFTGAIRRPGLNDVPFSLAIAGDPGDQVAITTSDPGPEAESVISVSSTLGSPRSEQTLRLSFSFPSLSGAQTVSWDSFSIATAHGVGYVFLDTRRSESLYRFHSDQMHFRIVFENDAIAIFELV